MHCASLAPAQGGRIAEQAKLDCSTTRPEAQGGKSQPRKGASETSPSKSVVGGPERVSAREATIRAAHNPGKSREISAPTRETESFGAYRRKSGSGGGTRTPDTRIIIPQSFVVSVEIFVSVSRLCRSAYFSRAELSAPPLAPIRHRRLETCAHRRRASLLLLNGQGVPGLLFAENPKPPSSRELMHRLRVKMTQGMKARIFGFPITGHHACGDLHRNEAAID